MSFNAIFAEIFTLLQQDATLVPTILGPRTVTNMRLYRAWPGMQQLFTSYEPNQPAEGFVIIEQAATGRRFAQKGYASNHEYMDLLFHVYGTTYGVTHDVLDVLDRLFHWTVEQERDVQWGGRWLLFSRRYQEQDTYRQEIKLYGKDITYFMEFAREEALVSFVE